MQMNEKERQFWMSALNANIQRKNPNDPRIEHLKFRIKEEKAIEEKT
jgi:hypothetical protein